jgi:phosphohistidine phosphatase
MEGEMRMGSSLVLYLMQHGEAAPESEDPARPLTARGRVDVERVAHFAARLDAGIALIRHSGKLRARQTAEIVAGALQPSPRIEEAGGLGPKDHPATAARALEDLDETSLLVGHLPHLARLVSLLVVGDVSKDILAFRMGALVALCRDEEGWRLRDVLTPEMAGE